MFEGFKRYVKKMKSVDTSFSSWLQSYFTQQCNQFINNVKNLTPVDTGDLRNHWVIDSIVREGDTLICTFSNSMEYATFVEYGHAKPYKAGAVEGSDDWVEGHFMVTISLSKLERDLPVQFSQQFRLFMSQLGN